MANRDRMAHLQHHRLTPAIRKRASGRAYGSVRMPGEATTVWDFVELAKLSEQRQEAVKQIAEATASKC
jgi:hypothetical protein